MWEPTSGCTRIFYSFTCSVCAGVCVCVCECVDWPAKEIPLNYPLTMRWIYISFSKIDFHFRLHIRCQLIGWFVVSAYAKNNIKRVGRHKIRRIFIKASNRQIVECKATNEVVNTRKWAQEVIIQVYWRAHRTRTTIIIIIHKSQSRTLAFRMSADACCICIHNGIDDNDEDETMCDEINFRIIHSHMP